MNAGHVDVLIIGAGLSGIGAACYLQQKCPRRDFLILEARGRIGGTWDFFRFPGMRSDSDMFTLSYSFRPWTGAKTIADGTSILNYIRATAREHGIDRKIRFQHRVTRASWSSKDARWIIEASREPSREPVFFSCNFLLVCSGYYNYAQGYAPDFRGMARFGGRIVHPQNWTADVDYANKRVIVIGSGATAVTLLPALAKSAAHVTMLQRSPSYIVAWPDEDGVADALRRWLPAKTAGALARWKSVIAGLCFYRFCHYCPQQVRTMICNAVRDELGPDYDVATHFTPRYNPWEQRLCLAPNGDFFEAIKVGRASIVTDTIKTFTETGLKLRSGRELEADLVVTATGLNLEVLGGARIDIDGEPVDPATTLTYKGALFSDIPNLAAVFGYLNAAWTLKAELIFEYVCRLLNHMEKHGYGWCIPLNHDSQMELQSPIELSSGYFRRALDKLPRQGSQRPWRIYQNYILDALIMRYARVDDGVLEFGVGSAGQEARRAALAVTPALD